MRVFISLIFLTFICNYAIAQASNDLLIDYNFDNSVNDSSGNDHHATTYGTTFVADRFGAENSALYFDGLDDYIEFPNLAELKAELPVSFSFWIKYDSFNINDREVFNTSFEEDRNTGVYFNTQSSTGNFAVNFGDGGYNYISSSRRTYVTNAQIDIDTWYHVAIIVNSELDMKIYIDCIDNDGVYSGSGGSLVYSDTAANIGRHDRDLSNLANYFKGTIDDFKYWSKSISVDEINNLCNSLSVEQQDLTEKYLFKIYPNPSNDGVFNIEINSLDFNNIKVFNLLGELVYNNKFDSILDLKYLSKGIYILNASGLGKSETRKIIIK
jgi:hypothetical protein